MYADCLSCYCCCLVAKLCPILCNPMVACQAPLSMGFSRQEYWSGLPFPSPGDLPDPGSNLHFLHWQADSLPLRHQGSPLSIIENPKIVNIPEF